jgi:hypothetical protein
MGNYIYTLKGPKHNVSVNINGTVESAAVLVFHYKPLFWGMWDKNPRWQRLAEARCARMDNVWAKHGFPKYVVNAFQHDDGKLDIIGGSVMGWGRESASICDGENAYDNLPRFGVIKSKVGKVYHL